MSIFLDLKYLILDYYGSFMIDSDEFLIKLGQIICRLRKERALSQSALGELSGCSQMTIQRIESGSRGGVRLESLIGISQAFQVPLADIFFEIENNQKEAQKSLSRWEYLSERIGRLNPSVRDWISDFLEKLLDRPWL